jgi:antitoxin VapB
MKSNDPVRRVRLFRNGRNQAVRIPREFELSGEEAILRREGTTGRLILEPLPQRDLLALLASWEPLAAADRLPEISDPPPEPVEL